MKYCFKSIGLLIKKYPGYLFVQILSTLIAIARSILPIYVVRDIINYYNDGKGIKEIAGYVLIVFGIIAVIAFIDYILGFFTMNIQRLFVGKTSEEFYKKLAEIDYDFHENPAFLNDYTRALEQGVDNIYQVANNSFQTIRILVQSFSLLSVFSILAKDNFMIIIFAFVIALIYLLIYIRIGFLSKKQHKLQRPFQRVSWYSNRAFSIRDGMADIKTSDIDKLLIENNEKSLDSAIKVYDKYASRITAWTYVGQIFLILLYPAIIGLLAYKNTDLAVFASLTVAATNISTLISQLATSIGEVESVLPDTKVPFDVLAMHGVIEGIEGKEKVDSFTSLDIENMSFSYLGDKNQLEDISLHIKKGEHIAIVGANGAGKTTLLTTISGIHRPATGTIEYNYNDTTYNLEKVKPHKIVALKLTQVPEGRQVFANLSVDDNLEMGAFLQKDKKHIKELKEKMYELFPRLLERKNYKAGTLSGGEQQMLAIARALMAEPELLLLDEPSMGLSPLFVQDVFNIIKRINEAGQTILLVEQNANMALKIADYAYVLETGKIVLEGNASELLSNADVKKAYLGA